MDWLNQTVAIIVGTAAVLTALSVIISKIINTRNKVDERFKNIIEKALETNNEKQDEKNQNRIDSLKQLLISEYKRIDEKLEYYHETDTKEKNSLQATISLLRESLIEAYKQDFRDIYYRLRLTGNIEDSEKAYLDKLYPKYEALGGNSDVHAKYKEICDIWSIRTKEKYDEAYEETKQKRKYTKRAKPKTEAELNEEEVKNNKGENKV